MGKFNEISMINIARQLFWYQFATENKYYPLILDFPPNLNFTDALVPVATE